MNSSSQDNSFITFAPIELELQPKCVNYNRASYLALDGVLQLLYPVFMKQPSIVRLLHGKPSFVSTILHL